MNKLSETFPAHLDYLPWRLTFVEVTPALRFHIYGLVGFESGVETASTRFKAIRQARGDRLSFANTVFDNLREVYGSNGSMSQVVDARKSSIPAEIP